MLQGLKQTVQRQIASVGVSSSTYLEMEKLKAIIEVLEKEIGDMKVELGGLVFEQWKSNAINMDVIDKICGQIQEREKKKEANIEETRQIELERQRLLNEVEVAARGIRCPFCGYQNQQEAIFCVACGRALSTVIEKEELNRQETMSCSNCGELLEEGSLYCSNCGAKVGEV